MDFLLDQLKETGLITQEEYDKQKEERQRHDQTSQGGLKSKFKGTKGIVAFDETQLDFAKTVNEFKLIAKEMLNRNPEAIALIIQKVHEFRDHTGNKKIVWFFYKVRDGLKNCPNGNREKLLKRMFRRNNPKFQLPEQRRKNNVQYH